MLKSWRLGQIFGFPVEINLSFLLLLAFVFFAYGGLAGLIVVGIAFASVVLHELGHALVARRLGVRVTGIELSFFGGAAKMVDMPRSADHEIAIAAAGPAVSLMLGGIGLGLGVALHVPLLATIGWINFVLAAFNLIPALPMDGGRILRALLTRKYDFVRATDISVKVSRVAAVAFAGIGLWYGAYTLLALAPMLWLMGSRERTLARVMADRYTGWGRGASTVYPRRERPFAGDAFASEWRGEPGPSGYRASAGFAGQRFVVRQHGGRLVIEVVE